MDISSAYMQLLIIPEHRKYTSFTVGLQQYQFNRFSFGMSLSGAYWQYVMQLVLGDLFGDHLLYYVDDLILCTDTIDQNLIEVEEVLRKLAGAGLKVAPKKTHFLVKEVCFLGMYHSVYGTRNDPEKLAPLFQMNPPSDKTTARSFMGIVNWWSKFVRDVVTE